MRAGVCVNTKAHGCTAVGFRVSFIGPSSNRATVLVGGPPDDHLCPPNAADTDQPADSRVFVDRTADELVLRCLREAFGRRHATLQRIAGDRLWVEHPAGPRVGARVSSPTSGWPG